MTPMTRHQLRAYDAHCPSLQFVIYFRRKKKTKDEGILFRATMMKDLQHLYFFPELKKMLSSLVRKQTGLRYRTRRLYSIPITMFGVRLFCRLDYRRKNAAVEEVSQRFTLENYKDILLRLMHHVAVHIKLFQKEAASNRHQLKCRSSIYTIFLKPCVSYSPNSPE